MRLFTYLFLPRPPILGGGRREKKGEDNIWEEKKKKKSNLSTWIVLRPPCPREGSRPLVKQHKRSRSRAKITRALGGSDRHAVALGIRAKASQRLGDARKSRKSNWGVRGSRTTLGLRAEATHDGERNSRKHLGLRKRPNLLRGPKSLTALGGLQKLHTALRRGVCENHATTQLASETNAFHSVGGSYTAPWFCARKPHSTLGL